MRTVLRGVSEFLFVLSTVRPIGCWWK